MARIAIGLPSGGLGHVSQALALARALPEHEILFLRGGEREALRSEGFEVAAIPTMRTHYRGHSIDTLRTGWEGTRNLFVAGRRTKKVVSILRDFGPDLVLTSYEPYTPLAAGRLGIPCIGIDNQRAITEGRYDAVGLIPWWRGAFAIPYLLWFRTPEYLAFNSFAVSEVRDRAKARAFRPLLAPEVLDLSPRKGDHVVAYQTTATSRALLKTLERLDVPCHVYGTEERKARGSLRPMAPNRAAFLEDLASCRFFISNGGHTAISEALHLGKPVLSFPVHSAYEQLFNAYMLRHLGYGDYSLEPEQGVAAVETFIPHLARFRKRIGTGRFSGNQDMAAFVNHVLVTIAGGGNLREAFAP